MNYNSEVIDYKAQIYLSLYFFSKYKSKIKNITEKATPQNVFQHRETAGPTHEDYSLDPPLVEQLQAKDEERGHPAPFHASPGVMSPCETSEEKLPEFLPKTAAQARIQEKLCGVNTQTSKSYKNYFRYDNKTKTALPGRSH